MPNEVRKVLLDTFRDGYQKTNSRKQKTKLIDDFCFVTKYSRKHAIRILNGKVTPIKKHKPGPKRKYDDDLKWPLYNLWLAMNKICSKRMVAALPLWLPYFEGLSSSQKQLISQMSASTIDRMLKPFRKKKGISTTKASMLKKSIPIELLDSHIEEPGHLEADTVSHCGSSVAGTFISSLTAVDLFSGWTENRATFTKNAESMRVAITFILDTIPFLIRSWSSDNGVEFLNKPVVDRLKGRKIKVIRRRPYKKNDAAHVEQKNWTHVRELFGYDRFDDEDLVSLMNEIYQAYWNPLQNLFMPMMKLKEKTRIGGKLIKKYDTPQTPYQRLMSSNKLTLKQRQALQQRMAGKNPFTLKRELETRLKMFFKIVERKKSKYLEAG